MIDGEGDVREGIGDEAAGDGCASELHPLNSARDNNTDVSNDQE